MTQLLNGQPGMLSKRMNLFLWVVVVLKQSGLGGNQNNHGIAIIIIIAIHTQATVTK